MLIFKHHHSELATGGVLQEKGVLRNFAKLTGKHLCQRLFFNKVVGLWHATLFKKSVSGAWTSFYRTPPDDCFCMYDL